MPKIVTLLQLVLLLNTSSLFAQEIDRTEYVTSAYSATKSLVSILKDAEEIKDQSTLSFIEAVESILNSNPPELIFVKGQEKFVIEEGSDPKLMRSHPDPDGPIFINEEMLNSKDLPLNFIQMVKLLLHELGHKTKFGSVGERDRWAQNIEKLLEEHYVTSNDDDEGPFVEAISLNASLLQVPLEENPIKLQPTFWVVVHHPARVEDITERLKNFVNENTILNRTIGTEILTAVTELTNMLAQVIKKKVAPLFDQIASNFNEPGRPSEINFSKSLKGLEGRIQSLSILEIRKISSSKSGITIESNQAYGRSHVRKHGMNITGFPWKDLEKFPIQIKVSEGNSIQTQLVTEPIFDEVAKVERVIREGGRLKSLEVSFSNSSYPYAVDLGLQNSTGQFRLRAVERTKKGGNGFLARFDFSALRMSDSEFTDRIIIDDEKTIFLNRHVEVSDIKTPIKDLRNGDVLEGSIGVWGKQGTEDKLKKEFSHLKKSILFFINPGDPSHFVINPYNLWIEFEVKSDIEVAQAELFWSREVMIFKTKSDEKNVITINEVNDDGQEVKQRYAAAGALLEQKTLREAILFDGEESIKIYPSSTPGYKVVRMKAITPLKHLRALMAPDEAHTMPAITPIGVRIVTKDLRTFTHSFPSEIGEDVLRGEFKRGCDEFLKSMD